MDISFPAVSTQPFSSFSCGQRLIKSPDETYEPMVELSNCASLYRSVPPVTGVAIPLALGTACEVNGALALAFNLSSFVFS